MKVQRLVAVPITVALLLGTSCGGRTDAQRGLPAGEAVTSPGGGEPSGETVPAALPAPSGPGSVPPTGAVPAPARSAGGAPLPADAAVQGQSKSDRTATPAAAAAGNDRTGSATVPTAPAPGRPDPSPAPATGKKSPVLVANVSILSGIAGSSVVQFVTGLQVWVKHVNAKGGVNGHPVQLIVYDDGGDPARHRSQVQEAVERRGVLAFLANAETFTGEGSVKYIESKRIPVVATDTTETYLYKSPMYFPQATSAAVATYANYVGMAQQLIPEGKTKLGTLVCVEADACKEVERIGISAAPELGFEHVYQGRASLGQPDYTAECLSAQRAGVQVLLVVWDDTGFERVANSCARQNYHPVYSSGIAVAIQDRFKNVPNISRVVAGTNVFPWFQSGTPATDEFHTAMRTYAKDLKLSPLVTTPWVGGKLFERVTAALPEPPTTEAILEGLWSLKDETLGGLTHPLNFVRERPAAPRACWFNIAMADKKWISPDGFKMTCRAEIPDYAR